MENTRTAAAALRRLGLRPVGGNYRTLKKLIAFYAISTDHFDPYGAVSRPRLHKRIPLEEVLVEGSTYNRAKLKQRLYDEGLRRKVERPPYEQLIAEIDALGYRGVGRKYGVSDNAARNWVRWYRARAEMPEDGAASDTEEREAA
ncbi:MAG TPA: hypothetical protein VFN87_19495 [Solirubrobacteraceae bacterium]|nr:hypothetical protein [Solirubrobacteraceae bacterium]